MENNLNQKQIYRLDYQGKGQEYFGIIIVNWLLTILTIGFYYPWAKAKELQYLYGATSLNGDSFSFHGTGKEMFKGFIKALLFIFTLYALFFLFVFLKHPVLGLILMYLGFFAIIPLAIHGSYRYRMSRTSWRGIRFGYRGDRKELTINFFKWIFLTIITAGVYGSWMTINLRKYVLNNIRFGSIEFEYNGDGFDYFVLNLKGYLLTVFTLGIYVFWWEKDLIDYYINNTSLSKDEKVISLKSTVTGGGIFKLSIINLLIIIFTLGFGYAWVVSRTLKYMFENTELEGTIDLNTIDQTEENYKDATGEDLGDFLDIDFI